MRERQKFIEDFLTQEYTMSELAEAYDISRPTAYKWAERFKQGGWKGLVDEPSSPRMHPNATTESKIAMILKARRKLPTWGPKKLRWRLSSDYPAIAWPVPSTIGTILKKNGLVSSVRRRRRSPPGSHPLLGGKGPNDVWAADFKGWFRTKDGQRVDPLTITDNATRFLLKCEIVKRQGIDEVKPAFERAFREFGLPNAIRTDNGPPFATAGLYGLSKLSVWWIRLGITPQRIKPGRPDQNGRHERMHKTLKQETARFPRSNPDRQQLASDQFRRSFNEERPHEAIGMIPPAQIYSASSRRYPPRLPQLTYSDDHTVKLVRPNGCILWRSKEVYLTAALAKEWIGLRPFPDGRIGVYFGSHHLGFLNPNTNKVTAVSREKV